MSCGARYYNDRPNHYNKPASSITSETAKLRCPVTALAVILIISPSRHDWKIVDWDVKPQHNQPNFNYFTRRNLLGGTASEKELDLDETVPIGP